jgi:hypothetical protein
MTALRKWSTRPWAERGSAAVRKLMPTLVLATLAVAGPVLARDVPQYR